MAENQIQTANNKQQIQAFNNIVNNAYYQNQLQKLFGKNAGTFATSMMELYTSNQDLQQCDPKLVAAEAMRAAALHLPLSRALSRAYVVVFKDHGVPKPQFLIGYLGLLDLALRSGQYETINTRVVYKGELLGEDKLSGFIDISGEKESNEVVGYLAYFKLVTGFKKMLYMDIKSMCHYAKMYAPTLKFNKIQRKNFIRRLRNRQNVDHKLALLDGLVISILWQKRLFSVSFSSGGRCLLRCSRLSPKTRIISRLNSSVTKRTLKPVRLSMPLRW